MKNFSKKLFVCFSAKDRYDIVQPVVYHLKNYGVDIWYDRHEMVMGDNRIKKNIEEGAGRCGYALIILSRNTVDSLCAREEIKILESRYNKREVVIFPVLYELKPCEIPSEFSWISSLIFKETYRSTGTLEICNHIACKITHDILDNCRYRTILEIVDDNSQLLPNPVNSLLDKYTKVDNANLNSRVALLYATYLTIIESKSLTIDPLCEVPSKAFERLFSETLLNLTIDYRELWLLENSICILIEHYITSCTESKI
ncbi:toll/interleukin-1 receptor domain-containing protein [Anaerosporobacter sp.]|uniref:toll/interleukin-1 receptor domain-containing protein n=1 Tax=Anaerosporobacter sp. TaxID=1872529 RepID=UPI00286F21A3|nr:toll/interleukin-1 receptor domain-containing protein [Anaerosporobacter sp.]